MHIEDCELETTRLVVRPWHRFAPREVGGERLEQVVVSLLTEPVTRELPEDWRGEYTLDRARRWIADRDAEGTTLLIVDPSTRDAVGFLFLAECRATSGLELRLGYVIGEPHWGLGLASELIEALVAWCRTATTVTSLAGGVSTSNPASTRVLEKNGFRRGDVGEEADDGTEIWRWSLRE